MSQGDQPLFLANGPESARRAIAWARLIVQGLDRPVSGGDAPKLAIDANDAFERFAKILTRDAVRATGDRRWQTFAPEFAFLLVH